MSDIQQATLAVTLMRWPAVSAATGLGKTKAYELMKKELFPRPYALTERARAWRSDEVQKWIDSRPRAEIGEAA